MYVPSRFRELEEEKKRKMEQEKIDKLFQMLSDTDIERIKYLHEIIELEETIKSKQEIVELKKQNVNEIALIEEGIKRAIETLDLLDDYEEWEKNDK